MGFTTKRKKSKTRFMKKRSLAKVSPTSQTSVFPKTLHRLRPQTSSATLAPKQEKRDNIFSKSRDTREDRGARQMKTSHNPQTFSHGR
jgi:hypothetical protein